VFSPHQKNGVTLRDRAGLLNGNRRRNWPGRRRMGWRSRNPPLGL